MSSVDQRESRRKASFEATHAPRYGRSSHEAVVAGELVGTRIAQVELHQIAVVVSVSGLESGVESFVIQVVGPASGVLLREALVKHVSHRADAVPSEPAGVVQMDDAVQMVVLGTSLADGQGSVDVASFANELEHVVVIRPPVFLVALRRDVIAVGIGLVGEYAAQRESLGQKAHVQIQSDLRVDVRDGRPRESGPVQASVGGIVVILRHDDLSVGRQRTGRRRRNDEQALVDAVQRVGRVIGRPLAADVAAQIDIAAQVLVQLDVHVRAVVEPCEVRIGLVLLVLGLEPAALMQEADV